MKDVHLQRRVDKAKDFISTIVEDLIEKVEQLEDIIEALESEIEELENKINESENGKTNF